MAVLLETSAGDIVIDLYTDDCPISTKNFLKLCKTKYYNGCLFYNLQPNYIIQTGDPTGTGKGGSSIYRELYGEQAKYFEDEIRKNIRHNKIGIVSYANSGPNTNGSQFFFTLRATELNHLDDKYTVFGEVAEGIDVLEKLNGLFVDEEGRPYQDVRIKHTHILEDPFPDSPALNFDINSPEREVPIDEKVSTRIPYEENLEEQLDGRSEAEIELSIKRKEAQSRAIVLEMTGDIPDAEVKPPVEVLFVCKLNAVTTDDDLELIFSRFGPIKQCEIIRDPKTGDSLNYAFIEFATEGACIEAYEKMNNVLIDDRRIKVDFSQSVSKLWNRFLLRPRSDKRKGDKNLQQDEVFNPTSKKHHYNHHQQGSHHPHRDTTNLNKYHHHHHRDKSQDQHHRANKRMRDHSEEKEKQTSNKKKHHSESSSRHSHSHSRRDRRSRSK